VTEAVGTDNPPVEEAAAEAEAEAAADESVTRDASRLAGIVGTVVAPATLVTAIAFYFGWRREQAFAGYFGIDTSLLDFSTRDYVLRSVDSLFVPLLALLLVALGALCLHMLIGRRRLDATAAPTAAAIGIGALFVGGMLAWGHGLWSSYVYLQALGPAVGAILLAYAFTLLRPGAASLTALRVVAGGVVLVSLFWATSEYAESRGRALAAKLAGDLLVNPTVTIFSKDNLGIRPADFGDPTCPPVIVTQSPKAAYRYRYDGFTFLLRSGGRYFVTVTPQHPERAWGTGQPVLIVPEDAGVRVQVNRGQDYEVRPGEKTAAGSLAFTC
jgi:hypothetical protein